MENGNGLDINSSTTMAAAFAGAQPKRGKSAMKKSAPPQAAATTTDTAIAVAVEATEPVAAPTSALKARTPAEIIAAARERRITTLAAKVAVDPQITEALEAVREATEAYGAVRADLDNQLRELKRGLGNNVLPRAQIEPAMRKVEGEIAEINGELEQLAVDSAALVDANSVGAVIAIIRQAAMRKATREITDALRANKAPSVNSITEAVDKAVKLGILAVVGSPQYQGEHRFNWSGTLWLSAVAADPTAFGLVHVMRKIIEERTARVQAQRREEEKYLISPNELKALSESATSLSAIMGGGGGHVVVGVTDQHNDKIVLGHILVEREDDKVLMRRVSNTLLINHVFKNRDGTLVATRPVKFRGDGTFDHYHPGVRRAFEACWKAEAGLRKGTEAVEERDAELAKFVAGKKAHPFDADSIAMLLKPTSAGAGFYPVPFAWKVEGGRKAPLVPCGVVLQKKGKRIRVAMLTTELKKLNEFVDLVNDHDNPEGFVGVADLPATLEAILRAACEQAGIAIPEILQP